MSERPHFIGIGAHKAGTTWLYENLRCHPDLWLPPYKELHAFDGLANMPRMIRRLNEALNTQAIGNPPAHARQIDFLRKFIDVQPKDMKWYRALFSEAGDLVCGEITPGYSTLDTETIRHIHEFLPGLKIVFIMRDPIDRAWSHLRAGAHKPGLNPDVMTLDGLKRQVDSPVSELRTLYTRTLANWGRFYGHHRTCVLFYDDLAVNPDSVLRTVCEFLGVRFDASYFVNARQQTIHKSRELPIRPELELHLARKYREEIAALQRRFGGHTDKWMANCDAILKGEC